MNIKLISNYAKFLESVIIIQRYWRRYKYGSKITNETVSHVRETISEAISETISECSNESNEDIKRYNLYRKRKYDDIYSDKTNDEIDNNEINKINNNTDNNSTETNNNTEINEIDNTKNTKNKNKHKHKKERKPKGLFTIFSSILKFLKLK